MYKYIYIFLVQKRLTGNILPILTLYSGEIVSTYVTSLGKNYDVMSVDNRIFICVCM